MAKQPRAKLKESAQSGEPPAGLPAGDRTPAATATGGAPAQGYTVLARRYRSREFDELIGQDVVITALQNAITQNRVAHAYLFTGTRGVGKTSTARLLAKALNATDELTERDAVAAAILRGDDMDVIEIDAASNTGVDNVRDLIASAGISPARSPYKIYIIDEVHMLSKSAFNALLKIMEEPPRHVKFILCTTEPERVPATIQSRCQRFDFRSLPTPRIAEHLRNVLVGESVTFEAEAVMQIARLANGSVRDALSLLDRLLSAADGRIDGSLLERTLGLPETALLTAIVDAVAEGSPGAALVAADQLLERGHTVERALEALIDHARALLLASVCGSESELIERSGEARSAVVAQASHFDAAGLMHMIAVLDAAARAARFSASGRAVFDAAIVRLALADQVASIPALIAALASGGGAAAEKKKPEPGFERAIPHAVVAARPPRRLEEASPGPGELSSRPAAPSLASSSLASSSPPRPVMPAPPTSAALESRPTSPPPRRSEPVSEVSITSTPGPTVTGPVAATGLSMDEAWEQICTAAAAQRSERVLVEGFEPVSFDGRTLRLTSRNSGGQMIRRAQGQLEELIRRALGRRIELVLDVVDAPAPMVSAAAAESVRSHPLVRMAIEIFDASIADISKPPS